MSSLGQVIMEYFDNTSKATQDTLVSMHPDTNGLILSSPVGNDEAVRNRQWYAIHVTSKYEKLAGSILSDKGYETYSPFYRSRRQWSDRVKELEVPLFPGYVFCRFDPKDRRVPVLSTPGVLRIVGAGRTPVPIGDEEIAAIRAVIKSGRAVEPWPYIRAGSRVRIERGALAGVEGVVLSTDKKSRLIVSLHLLQRSVAVELDRDWTSPVMPRSDDSRAAGSFGNS